MVLKAGDYGGNFLPASDGLQFGSGGLEKD
jgi:hypothetical protein